MGRTRRRSGPVGVTFLELGTVLALVGLLSVIGYNAVGGARKNALRVRCRAALSQVHRFEVLHAATHGRFTDRFAALEELGLSRPLDRVYAFDLTASATGDAFRCVAWANLDRDADADSLVVTQAGDVESLFED